jgi:transposase
MGYRPHTPPTLMLFGYDPVRDLPEDHLARLVELVVEEAKLPRLLAGGRGQPAFDPRLCAKILAYGYATGVRSSRQLERMCNESLPYLFLTRGDTPSYRTLCTFRIDHSDLLEQVWVQLFATAGECGMQRLGRIVIDSSKFRADASPEAVVKAKEYDALLQELKQILKEAQEADTQDQEDPPGQTRTGQPVQTEQMRDIVRRVRKQISARAKGKEADPVAQKPLGTRMQPRLEATIKTLETAQKEGDKFACLTDPDARMMGEGREKRIRECHSFEVVVDADAGLLVVGQTCQSSVDNPRLEILVQAAQQQEPNGIVSVDADSGYYSGDAVGRLISSRIDTCIPDSNTACDLHRGHRIGTKRQGDQGSVILVYDKSADLYRCPEGNLLKPSQRRAHCGQEVTLYRAEQPCSDCPQKDDCLTQAKAKHRTVTRGDYAEELEAARQRFGEAEHQDRYHHRGDAVETVFGFVRGTLGYGRWLLRGKERVAHEGRLFKLAYQLRKVHRKWSLAMG